MAEERRPTDTATDEDTEVAALFARMPEPAAREALVERFRPLAVHLSRRFRGRAEQEDLEQVALLALLKAIDRFEPDRGAFVPYASVTVAGELKRHLRDTGWAVRVPRRLQEVGLAVSRTVDELTQSLGRSPTVPELAEAAGLTEDEVLEGLDVGSAYQARSLDAPAGNEDDGPSIEPAAEDESMAMLEEWADVAGVLRTLPERERWILYLRFFRNMSQSAIAEQVGISQMHVSRLLAKTLAQLREATESPAGAGS
jgi:RNA polymerase sigma-B factor